MLILGLLPKMSVLFFQKLKSTISIDGSKTFCEKTGIFLFLISFGDFRRTTKSDPSPRKWLNWPNWGTFRQKRLLNAGNSGQLERWRS